MPIFSTPQPIKATVQVAGARVRVRASARTDTDVQVEPVDPTNRKDTHVVERTTVEHFGGELQVKTRRAGDKQGSVIITIDLPAGSDLDLSLAHSTIEADGPIGACAVNLASGRVRLEAIAKLRASLAAGELVIGHLAGRADIEGGATDVRIGTVDGPVKLTGSSGQVWIGDAAADLDLTNSTAGFDIGRAGGNVTAMTGGKGAIRIGRMTRGHAYLTNAAGTIEIGVGERTAVRLERTETTFGSVRNTAPAHPELDGTELVTVDARTRRGDIVIQRAAS